MLPGRSPGKDGRVEGLNPGKDGLVDGSDGLTEGISGRFEGNDGLVAGRLGRVAIGESRLDFKMPFALRHAPHTRGSSRGHQRAGGGGRFRVDMALVMDCW